MNIYLDNCATTKVRDEVLTEIINTYSKDYGNPSSLHRMGLTVEKQINTARKNVASLINASEKNILFTSGGTESNNIAINSHMLKINKNNNIVTTIIEHASIYNVFRQYEKKGYDVRYLDTDRNGFIDTNSLEKLVDEKTGLISIIYVNNEIGTIQKLDEIIKYVRNKNSNIKIHVDAIQAIGKIPIDVKKLNVDSMSFSSHKIHGPKGVGGLYISSKSNFEALMYGGGQEGSLRPGTENTPGIIGFGKACELIKNDFKEEVNKLNMLKSAYAKKLSESIDDIIINSMLDNSGAPHVLSVSFKDVKAEVLVHYLENYDIYVSTGAACSSKSDSISRTLEAIGLNENYINGTIRLSFGYFNDIKDVDFTVDKIRESVEDIRKITRLR